MSMRQPVRLLGGTALLALLMIPGTARADILDIAIEIVAPELAPAKPVLKCVIGGGEVKGCALASGKAGLEKDPDFKDILEVHNLAQSKQWNKLVAKVGVTAVCASFAVPGKDIICDEFSGHLANAGTAVVGAGTSVVKDAGNAVANQVAKGLIKLDCALGFSCPGEKDPNYFDYDTGYGVHTIRKWDLNEVWKIDYVARVDEGIKARISDPKHFARMISDPPGLNYNFSNYDPDTLGYHSVHKRVVQQEKDDGIGASNNTKIYPGAFRPFGKELTARWTKMVNVAAAKSLESTADKFEASSKHWMTTKLGSYSLDYFEMPKLKGWNNSVLAQCRAEVEAPASALPLWAAGAKQARDDGSDGPASKIRGKGAADWTKLRDWCEHSFAAALGSDMKKRKTSRDIALGFGCKPKASGARGLDCPAQSQNNDNPLALLVSPIGHCKTAYHLDADKYCAVIESTRAAAPETPPPPSRKP